MVRLQSMVKDGAVGCCVDFKAFISRGNVVDLAVAFILGAAFGAIVKSLVDDVIMPVVSLAGEANMENMFVVLRYANGTKGMDFNTILEAQTAGATTLNYGRFVNTVVNFFILAIILFLMVKTVMCCYRPDEPEPSTDFGCPKCAEMCKEVAVKCPHCGTEPIGKAASSAREGSGLPRL